MNSEVMKEFHEKVLIAFSTKISYFDINQSRLFSKQIVQPHVANMPRARPGLSAVLQLDEFKAHHTAEYLNLCASSRIVVETIPGQEQKEQKKNSQHIRNYPLTYNALHPQNIGGFTSVLQPLDVGINKPFKDHIKTRFTKWANETYTVGMAQVPLPSRRDVLIWVRDAWAGITGQTILNTYNHIGYPHASSLAQGI